jgi:hypothetical protein
MARSLVFIERYAEGDVPLGEGAEGAGFEPARRNRGHD